ncbi:MAG: alkaline phosphatase [Planctomycetota bacterium]|jgi:alkaline phosphatase
MKSRICPGFLALLIVFLVLFPGCRSGPDETSRPPAAPKIKNVIFLIADGMGPQSLGLLISYAKYAPNSIYVGRGRATSIEKAMRAGTLGFAYHEASGVLVSDSAAAATQMASGKPALSETVGVDRSGEPTETILEIAKSLGKSTGLVSDTRLTHATPAGFAAHRTHRSMENEIALDLLENRVDVMLSGGLRHWIPKASNDPESEVHKDLETRTGGGIRIASKRKDERNLILEAEKLGYALAFDRDQLARADGGRILGLFGYSALPYRIDLEADGQDRTVPSLREMASKALDVLSKNEKGFFLMVESGLIDWCGHDNDAGGLLHEMIRFDETLDAIRDWAEGRDDTLLIITADHETGGFGFSYSRKDVPKPERFPGDRFPEAEFAPKFNFGSPEILDGIHRQKKSFQSMLNEFDALSDSEKNAGALARIVNRSLEFELGEEEVGAVLEREPNEYRVEGHAYLSADTFPKIDGFKAFHVYGDEVRKNLLGRALSRHQNVVWSTGTHTSTPVPLIVLGPEEIRKGFGGLLHTTQWARMAIAALKEGAIAGR